MYGLQKCTSRCSLGTKFLCKLRWHVDHLPSKFQPKRTNNERVLAVSVQLRSLPFPDLSCTVSPPPSLVQPPPSWGSSTHREKGEETNTLTSRGLSFFSWILSKFSQGIISLGISSGAPSWSVVFARWVRRPDCSINHQGISNKVGTSMT